MKNIQTRLTEQLIRGGMPKSKAGAVAHKKMVEAGNVTPSGELTAKGKKRSAMGAAGRAKDRAAKESGRKTGEYTYNQLTNRARLKK